MSAYQGALFLDLDGTIIQTKSGKRFPKNINDWEFNANVLDRILEAMELGYRIYIVTNQGGIGKFLTSSDFDEKIETIIERIAAYCFVSPAKIKYRYCSTLGSYFHKPNPGMAYDLALEDGIILSKSIMVGDASGLPGNHSDSDQQLADNIGALYLDIETFLEYGISGYAGHKD